MPETIGNKHHRGSARGKMLQRPFCQLLVRLLCFPPAGAGSGPYRTWQSYAPPFIKICPVQLPGREKRFGVPPFYSIEPLLEALATELQPIYDVPFAFFGHSL